MYEKTVDCGALKDNAYTDIPLGSTYSKIVSISGMMYHQVTSGYDAHSVAIPCVWMDEGKFTGIQLYMYRDKIRIRSFSNVSTFYTKSEVTVRYIKD